MDFFAEKDHDNKAAPSTDHADKKDDLDRPTTLEFNVNVREYIVLFSTIILYCITGFFLFFFQTVEEIILNLFLFYRLV